MASLQEVTTSQLLGVAISDGLYREERGYGLVVTREKVIGARKPESMKNFHIFLERTAPEHQLADAVRAADALMASKEFELRVGSIGQVLFKKPSLLSGGYFIIKTGTNTIRIDISVLYVDPNLSDVFDTLVDSFYEAVGWRLCDGRTGEPLQR